MDRASAVRMGDDCLPGRSDRPSHGFHRDARRKFARVPGAASVPRYASAARARGAGRRRPGSTAGPAAGCIRPHCSDCNRASPKQEEGATGVANKPADQLAAAERETIGYAAAPPPPPLPPPPPPPSPAPAIAQKSAEATGTNEVVITGSLLRAPQLPPERRAATRWQSGAWYRRIDPMRCF